MTSSSSKIEDICALAKKWETSERINWDEYFMCLATLTSTRSPCSRLHVGCVLVKDKRVISMGYNGFPTGEDHNSVIRVGEDGKKHEMATIHAEQNAICYGANTGVSLKDATAYVTHYPCLNCAKLLISCGITDVIYCNDYHNDDVIPVVCSKLRLRKF